MNSLKNCIKHHLFLTNPTDDYLHKLYEFCLTKAAGGDLVLILTSKLYDFGRLMEHLNINKDQIKNLIIMHYKSIEEISRKLLQLHSWSLQPTFVAVDLFHLIQLESNSNTFHSTLMQWITICTVALFTYLQSIALQQGGRETTNKKAIIQDDRYDWLIKIDVFIIAMSCAVQYKTLITGCIQ